MSDFLRNLSDKALLELKEARGDMSKLSDESLLEIKYAKDINKPTPSLRDMQVKNTPVWQSAAMGAANTMSMGLMDEVGGAARAASQNVLSKFTDSAKPTTWDAETQRLREGQAIAKEANPGAFMAGQIGGGLASPALMTAKAGTGILATGGINAAASALSGGLQRAGDAESNRLGAALDPASVATDATIGGVLGMGGAAIAKGVRAAKSGDLLDGVADYANATMKGLKPEGTINKAIELPKELFETAKMRSEAAAIVSKARKENATLYSNKSNKAVLEMLLAEPGDNLAKQWVLRRTSTELGVPKDRFGDLLNMTGEQTAAARRFDKRAAGKDLAGQLDDTLQSLDNTRKTRVQDLTEQARANFTGEGSDEVLTSLFERSAMGVEEGASDLQKTIGRVSEEGRKLLEEGRGLPSQGLTRGDFTEADNVEQFKRLQKLREFIDPKIDWDAIQGKNGKSKRLPTPEERELMTLRSQIDQVLKTSPEKIEADRLVADSSGLMKSIRKAVTHDGEVDQYKVARMLADTDGANRFRDSLPELEDYANRLGGEEGAKATKLVEEIKKAVSQAEIQRDLGRFKIDTVGVSGNSLEKWISSRNKNSLLQDALQNPDLFLKRREAVNQLSVEMFGKPFHQLQQEDKFKLLRNINKIKFEGGEPDLGVIRQSPKFQGGDSLGQVKDLAINRAGQMAGNELYSAVTGEEGLPDPLKDEAVEYLKEKYGLSDEQAATLKKVMPGLYDAAGMVRSGASKMVPSKMYKKSKLADAEAVTDPKAMESAIDQYAGHGTFHDVRKAQKTGEGRAFELAKALKGVTQADDYALEKPTNLWRFHQSQGYDPAELKVGDEITSDRLLSFTTNKAGVSDFMADAAGSPDNYIENANVVFKVNRGTQGGFIGGNEDEVLMPEGVNFEVVKTKWDDKLDKYVVELKEKTKRDLKAIDKRLASKPAETPQPKESGLVKLSANDIEDLEFAARNPERLAMEAKRLVQIQAANAGRYVPENEIKTAVDDLISRFSK